MPDTYCGVGKIPKGKRLGSMKECVEKGEIRFYGLKKIDERLIEAMKEKKYSGDNSDDLFIKVVGLKGKLKFMIKKIQAEKDDNKKDKLKKSAKKLHAEIKILQGKMKKSKKSTDKKSKSKSKQNGGGEKIVGTREFKKN